jgi:hypothetical protein
MWGIAQQRVEQKLVIERAKHEGLKAWRLCVVNAMLADMYHNKEEYPRPYSWSRSELSQLAGVDIQTVSERDAETNRP